MCVLAALHVGGNIRLHLRSSMLEWPFCMAPGWSREFAEEDPGIPSDTGLGRLRGTPSGSSMEVDCSLSFCSCRGRRCRGGLVISSACVRRPGARSESYRKSSTYLRIQWGMYTMACSVTTSTVAIVHMSKGVDQLIKLLHNLNVRQDAMLRR